MPTGYHEEADHYWYSNLKGPDTWPDAEKTCQRDGAHVPILFDGETEVVVGSWKEHVWIGLNDQNEEGIYVYQNGDRPSFTHWDSGEPNNDDNEDCVVQKKGSLLWNDIDCVEWQWKYVCQFDPN